MQILQSDLSLCLCVLGSRSNADGFATSWHRHPFQEIGFVLEGECQWGLKRRPTCLLKSGQAILVPPECDHRELATNRVQLGWVGYASGESSRKIPSLRVLELGESAQSVRFLLQRLYYEQQAGQKGGEELCGLALKHLLILVERAAGTRVEVRKKATLNVRQAQVVRSVAAYLERNANRPLTLEQIARYHNLSSPHLSWLFRKFYHITPTAFRLRCRMELAKTLLENRAKSVKEVAAACGFSDAAHFCREFKRAEGRSPGKA